MKQRILVLGANGYVGRRVVAALAASDWAEPVAGVRRARQQGREIVLEIGRASVREKGEALI